MRTLGIGLVLATVFMVSPASEGASHPRSKQLDATAGGITLVPGCSLPSTATPLSNGSMGCSDLVPHLGATRAAEPVPCVPVPAIDSKCEQWSARYNGAAGDYDGPGDDLGTVQPIVSSVDGSVVFTTLASDSDPGTERSLEMVTTASDANTGAVVWTARLAAADADLFPTNVVADPNGATVYAVARGYADGAGCSTITEVVAYDAATGQEQWRSRETAADGDCTYVYDVLAGNDALFVVGARPTGGDFGGSETFSITTYETRDSQRLGDVRWSDWAFKGGFQLGAVASTAALSPDGQILYVGGAGIVEGSGFPKFASWLIRGYDVGTGDVNLDGRWDAPEPGAPSPANPPAGLVVSPDGSTIFLTGGAEFAGTTSFDIVTLAMDAATADVRWTSNYEGIRSNIKSSFDSVWYRHPMAISPDGDRLFIAGYSTCLHGANICSDFVTLAYNSATGAQEWATRHTSEQWIHWTPAVAVSPDGNTVYMSGPARHFELVSARYATMAYSADDGAEEWVARYTDGYSFWSGFALSPDGSKLFVTGSTSDLATQGAAEGGETDEYDALMVAHNT